MDQQFQHQIFCYKQWLEDRGLPFHLAPSARPSSASVVFLAEQKPDEDTPEAQLIINIVRSLKLAASEVEVVYLSDPMSPEKLKDQPAFTVCFGEDVRNQIAPDYNSLILTIPSPSAMVDSPELKRAAWNTLQQIIQALKK
jgi:hypothetical protein